MTREEKQKAIDALKISTPVMGVTQEEFNDYFKTLNKIRDWLEQEPKTGHWIVDVYRWGDMVTTANGYRCDKCNAFNSDKDNYCPNCGCRMVDPQESEG